MARPASAARSRCASRTKGADVVVGDLRSDPREGGEPIGDLLGERGVFVEADASKWADVDRLVSTAVDRGRLDVMVCNGD